MAAMALCCLLALAAAAFAGPAWAASDQDIATADAKFFIAILEDDSTLPDSIDQESDLAPYIAGYTSPALTLEAALATQEYRFDITGKAVAEALAAAPTDEQIKDACTNSGISFDPETQTVIWYVVKKESDGWHVDGMLIKRSALPEPEEPEDPEEPDDPANPEDPEEPEDPADPEGPPSPDIDQPSVPGADLASSEGTAGKRDGSDARAATTASGSGAQQPNEGANAGQDGTANAPEGIREQVEGALDAVQDAALSCWQPVAVSAGSLRADPETAAQRTAQTLHLVGGVGMALVLICLAAAGIAGAFSVRRMAAIDNQLLRRGRGRR